MIGCYQCREIMPTAVVVRRKLLFATPEKMIG
eukprot:COSAG01_NODE_36132_length_521_cov_8.514218_1_plen_31_part_01